MADVPPPVAGASLQAGFQAAEALRERDARRAGEAASAQRKSLTATDVGDTVETTDADARVFTESEGSGSQGRAYDEQLDEGSAGTSGNHAESTPGNPKNQLDLEA